MSNRTLYLIGMAVLPLLTVVTTLIMWEVGAQELATDAFKVGLFGMVFWGFFKSSDDDD